MISLEDTREVKYSEYRDLLTLYIQQMGKTDSLQRENAVLHNLVEELRSKKHEKKKQVCR